MVCPALICKSTWERASSSASLLYRKETLSKSMLPLEISVFAPLGEESAISSSRTSPIRCALAKERVSRRNTFEIIIMEFMT